MIWIRSAGIRQAKREAGRDGAATTALAMTKMLCQPLGYKMMNKKILVAIAVNVALVGTVSAGQFLTKQDERNGIVSPGDPVVNAGGDSCATATVIASTPFNDTGNTTGASNSNNNLPSGCSDYTQVAGPDHIYTFTTTVSSSDIVITLTPTGASWDPAIYVLGTCGTAATCITGSDAELSGTAETISGVTFPVGTYALYVDSFYSTTNALSRGAYTLNFAGTLPVQLMNFSVD